MPYLSEQELHELGLRSVGKKVRISDRASICNPELLCIGDNSRIDDFCVVSGKVTLGRNVHLSVFCNIAGGEPGIVCEDFSGISYASHVLAQSDDYSGRAMTGPTVPQAYKSETKRAVHIGRHCIVGASSVILPGVVLAEGTSVGAMTLVVKSTDAWSIYVGIPARRIRARSRDLLLLEARYLEEESARDGVVLSSGFRAKPGGAA